MRIKLVVISLIAIVILIACVFIKIWENNDEPDEFDVPNNSKYTIIYSTGEYEKEKSQINYIDRMGKIITTNTLKNVICKDGINYNKHTNTYNVFTHDKIYFSGNAGNNSIENRKILSTYKFASEDGLDEVYYSDYLNKSDMYLKHIPHGLAYEERKKGNFDLLVFYNKNKIYNIEISESGSVTTNQDNGIVYNFTGDSNKHINYDIVKYNEKNDEFNVSKKNIDLSSFFKNNNLDDDLYFLGKTLSLKNKVYQIIHVGDETFKTYLVEYLIDGDTQNMTYQTSYPIKLAPGETISIDTVARIDNNEIKYYSPIKPNKIIIFNFKQERFRHELFSKKVSGDEGNPCIVKKIDNKIYVLYSDIENEKYFIYSINKNNNFNKLIDGKLPKSNISSDWWVTDYYVNN